MTDEKVKSCFNSCHFFFSVPGEPMLCTHPKWGGTYEGAIITHENSKGRVPDECPLREAPITIIKTISL